MSMTHNSMLQSVMMVRLVPGIGPMHVPGGVLHENAVFQNYFLQASAFPPINYLVQERFQAWLRKKRDERMEQASHD